MQRAIEEGRAARIPDALETVKQDLKALNAEVEVDQQDPADMCGWTGHIQGNLAPRVCEPPCGECMVRR